MQINTCIWNLILQATLVELKLEVGHDLNDDYRETQSEANETRSQTQLAALYKAYVIPYALLVIFS